jgi:hypothetical protein
VARVRSLAQLDLDLSAAVALREAARRRYKAMPHLGFLSEDWWRLDDVVARLRNVIAGKEARLARRERQQTRCHETDSAGVRCEVLGRHTEHACPEALQNWLRVRRHGYTGQ